MLLLQLLAVSVIILSKLVEHVLQTIQDERRLIFRHPVTVPGEGGDLQYGTDGDARRKF